MRRQLRRAGLLLLAAACAGDEHPWDPCRGVTCGAYEECAPGSGDCICDATSSWTEAGCKPLNTCVEESCSGREVCDDSSGVAGCTCDEGYAGRACGLCDEGLRRSPTTGGCARA